VSAQKVFVTGASGLLGSNMCHRLSSDGYDVVGLVRNNSNLTALNGFGGSLVRGDLSDENWLARQMEGVDFVFHSAGLVTFDNRRREELYRVNVDGTRNVARAAIAARVKRLIHVSSVAAVGIPAAGELADESIVYNKFKYHIAYADSKHFGEVEIEKAVSKGLDAVIINPATIIGRGDVYFHSGVLLKIFLGKRIVPYVAGGMCVVGVYDVVDAGVSAMTLGRKGERYIIGGENLTFREFFGQVAGVLGAGGIAIRVPRLAARTAAALSEIISSITLSPPLLTSAHVVSSTLPHYYSFEKAKRELGFTPHPVETSIRQSFEWYRENNLI